MVPEQARERQPGGQLQERRRRARTRALSRGARRDPESVPVSSVPVPEWEQTGSVVMQTEQYRLATTGLELLLTRSAKGSWLLRCESLWSGAQLVVVGPSDATAEQSKLMALMKANERINELGRSLPAIATRALG